LKRVLVYVLKFAIPLAVIGYLLYRVDEQHPGQFRQLWEQPKNWPLLGAGFALVMLAVCLSFIRWWVLVRALHLPFRLVEALRLGFLGYLLNFIGLGSVGGDLIKAVFLAHRQPGRRTEAVATVILDRIIGLYVLFVVASITILVSGLSQTGTGIRAVRDLTFVAAAGGTVALGLMLGLPFHRWRVFYCVCRIPKIGPVIGRLVSALRTYRGRLGALAVVLGMSVVIHVMLPIAMFLIASALFANPPTLTDHLVAVPLSLSVGAIPTPGGLGTFELAMDQLYKLLAPDTDAKGIVVALAYRLITIVVAAIGAVFYLTSRGEVRQLLEEAAEEQEREAHEYGA
jgi:uncharacterized membrane protein YbhN (UPF0104 family)